MAETNRGVQPGPITLVIFDCDGVLIDSERLAVRVDAELLTELGWPLSEAEVFAMFGGRSQADMFAEVAVKLGKALPPGWQSIFERRYREAFTAELAPIDGIVEALDAITCKTCVASSSTPEQLRLKLTLTNLYEHFRGRIFSSSDVENGKPAPDLFLHAAREMGVPPAECVVVEDSQYGVQAARSAGMRCFAFSGGLATMEQLEGPGTTTFADMHQLPHLIADAQHGRRDPAVPSG